jgi:hypothetical protein
LNNCTLVIAFDVGFADYTDVNRAAPARPPARPTNRPSIRLIGGCSLKENDINVQRGGEIANLSDN